MKRIYIVGTSASGKTTLARSLSKKLGIIHKELDSMYWGPNWTPVPNDEFLDAVAEFTKQDTWIVDGNYRSSADLILTQATHVIWLDYTLPFVLRRFFTRSFNRMKTKETLWHGNKDNLWNTMLKPNSLLVWIFKSYQRNRSRYLQLKKSELYSHIEFIHLSNSEEAFDFLRKL